MKEPKPPSANYSRLRRRLLIGLCAIAVLVTGVVSWQIFSSYAAEKEAARRQTESFVHAIEAHVAHSVELVDLSLVGFAGTIGTLSPAKRQSAEGIQQLLLSQGAALSANFWILYIDAQGLGVAATKNIAVRGLSYADRDYFKAHTVLDHGRFVGEPFIGKASKSRLFAASRRVQSPDGEFLGVVAALMSAEEFAKVFQSARFNQDVSITLAHRNGKVIARSPLFEHAFGTDISGGELMRRVEKAPAGTYQTHSVVDQQSRIFSYQTISHLPLIVTVGISSQAWDRALKHNIVLGGGGIFLIVGMMLLSLRLALKSYANLEQSEDRYRTLYAEIQTAEKKLKASEKQLRTITDNVPAMIAYIDRNHILRFANGAFRNWLGLPPTELTDRPLIDVVGAELYEQRRANVDRALSGERISFEIESVLQGENRYLQAVYIPDRLDDGSIAGIYTLSTDVTRLKENEKQLEALARFDSLTGLANRRELDARLDDAIKRCHRSKMPMAVMFLDVDHFKSINDQYGHAAGDEVLKQVAKRLQASLRTTDTVSRLAGDEFVVVLEKVDAPADVQTVAAKILAALNQPVLIESTAVTVTISIGICFSHSGHASAAELLARADKALYDAKAAGRNTYVIDES